MFYQLLKNTFFIIAIVLVSCLNQPSNKKSTIKSLPAKKKLVVGANQTKNYLPFLKEEKIGIVANPTSVIFKENGTYTHIVDSLVKLDVNIQKVFSPEHGFRGTADAGQKVGNGKDVKTGIPIISLYGNHKKPTTEDLKGISLMVFDVQDVGIRFYTYISTLTYVMEACAEQNIPLLILDRPNPNGHYIDGPILEKKYQSFVGLHSVPIVHGMTMGEYAKMVNGEKWLKNEVQCDLTVIPVKNYTKNQLYSLPIKPSPNLPNDLSINLYPSLCFFEGTPVNAGRGTSKQFQVFGSPSLDSTYFNYRYTPRPNPGASNPKHKGEVCYGKDLSQHKHVHQIHLEWLIEAYQHTQNKSDFFTSYFNKLAGTAKLQQQIKAGMSQKAIKKTWYKGLRKYENMREPYLLYPQK